MCRLWLSRLCFQRLRAAEGGKTAGFLFGRGRGGCIFIGRYHDIFMDVCIHTNGVGQ